jgi:hypothetical protein
LKSLVATAWWNTLLLLVAAVAAVKFLPGLVLEAVVLADTVLPS